MALNVYMVPRPIVRFETAVQGHRDAKEVVPNHQTPVESITQELADSLLSGGVCNAAVRPGMCQDPPEKSLKLLYRHHVEDRITRDIAMLKKLYPIIKRQLKALQISQIAPCKPEKIISIPYLTLQ